VRDFGEILVRVFGSHRSGPGWLLKKWYRSDMAGSEMRDVGVGNHGFRQGVVEQMVVLAGVEGLGGVGKR
jgi:hypothetical protein